MQYFSASQVIEYKRTLESIYTYLENAIEKNYPIKQNAQFILELMKMRDGVYKNIHATDPIFLPSNGFVAIDDGMISFNYNSTGEMSMIDEDTVLSNTLVLITHSPFVAYTLTQHVLPSQTQYDFKYFNVSENIVKTFDGIIDEGSLTDLFMPQRDMDTVVSKVKEISYQIDA